MLRIEESIPRILTTALIATSLIFLFVSITPGTAAAQDMTDEDITLAVLDGLVEDDAVAGYNVDVVTDDGVVTLSGTVNNVRAKIRATHLAQVVKGVRSVVNNIEVYAPGRTDMQIQDDVLAALMTNPATDSWEVDLTVNNGKVTLTGTVNSWYEKQLAEKVVSSVRGVRSVTNNISVNYEQDRPDGEIAAEVREKLDWDVLVDGDLIEVTVDGNTVKLTGVVGSAAEKRYAVSDAWVTNVEEVDAGNLKVESWARDDRFRKRKYTPKDDEDVKAAIADALFYDPRVISTNVNVRVDSGEVVLSGKVDNLKAKRSSTQVARNTVGVWSVKNQIKVRPEMTKADSTIETDVREALVRDPYVKAYNMKIVSNNGVVDLNGTVDTYFDKAQADDIAAQVSGVVAVDNNLMVDEPNEALVYSPYVDYDWWYPYDYDWYVIPNDFYVTSTDWEIQEEIKDEMWWSPYVESDQVNVTVENGKATLTGEVDTWNERLEATTEAYQGGAVAVDNNLTVQYGPEFYR